MGDVTARVAAALGDRYVLEREIGRGGWATVYLAQDRKHDRRVAIKVFRPELAWSLGTGRFLNEIRLVARLQHPHICPLHDSGEAEDAPWFVMPYIAGESLRERLGQGAQLPVDEAVQIAREVASALAYAHAHGVVHRDIKPENILLSAGHAVVVDFGIAKALSEAGGDRLSQPGVVVGTPAYMSPEQALGERAVDHRADIYSLGCVLYEMLAGVAPPPTTLDSIVDRRLRDRVPRVSSLRNEVPEWLDVVVRKAIAVDPADRFQSAAELEEALGGGPMPGDRRRTQMRWLVAGVAIAAGVAVMLTGVALWRRAREIAALPAAEPNVVAVLPFAVRGSQDFGYLGRGMVDLLSTDLDGAGDLRAVDAHAIFGAANDSSHEITPVDARQIARRLGAGVYVLGSVTGTNASLRLTAGLYDLKSDAPLATASAAGVPDSIFPIVDRLAADLLRAHGGIDRTTALATVTTSSIPALKAYLAGEDLLRTGRPDSAMIAFGRAIDADTLFALAYYRRAVAADWAADFEAARIAAADAIAHDARLSPTDRTLLSAFLAWHRGDADEAEQLYRDILRRHPDNVEAWYQLGEVLFHYGPVRGRSIRDARGPFERALAYDATIEEAMFHLLDIAARDGDMATYRTLLARVKAPSEIRLRREAVLAFASGNDSVRSAMLDTLRGASDGTVLVAAGSVAAARLDPATAERISRLLTIPGRDTAWQAIGRVVTAEYQLSGGRWADAQASLDTAAQIDPSLALIFRAYWSAIRFLPADTVKLRALASRLSQPLPPPRAWPKQSIVVRVHDAAREPLRLYVLGLIRGRLGQRDAANAIAATLDARDSVTDAGFSHDLAAGVRANAAWTARDLPAASAALAGIRARSSLDLTANSPFYAHAAERYMRGEILLATGHDREALGWFESLGEMRFDAPFMAAATLRAGEIYERLGDIPHASQRFRQAIAMWRNADPALRPLLDEAKQHLAGLGATE